MVGTKRENLQRKNLTWTLTYAFIVLKGFVLLVRAFGSVHVQASAQGQCELPEPLELTNRPTWGLIKEPGSSAQAGSALIRVESRVSHLSPQAPFGA